MWFQGTRSNTRCIAFFIPSWSRDVFKCISCTCIIQCYNLLNIFYMIMKWMWYLYESQIITMRLVVCVSNNIYYLIKEIYLSSSPSKESKPLVHGRCLRWWQIQKLEDHFYLFIYKKLKSLKTHVRKPKLQVLWDHSFFKPLTADSCFIYAVIIPHINQHTSYRI